MSLPQYPYFELVEIARILNINITQLMDIQQPKYYNGMTYIKGAYEDAHKRRIAFTVNLTEGKVIEYDAKGKV